MKTLLSLFDYSGTWASPYMDAGWQVWTWDVKAGHDINIFKDMETTLELLEDVDGILAAPPCTDFAVSGAQYWKTKDQDGRTNLSLQLVDQVACLVDAFEPTCPDYLEEMGDTFFYCIENPVGRISKLRPWLGSPRYFDPCDYAGYLGLTNSEHNELDRIRRKDGKGVTWEEIEMVMKLNAYTKKTGLWGNFEMPEKDPIEPVRCAPQGSWTQKLGGSSERTKELRSMTPLGFAKAFYQANMALTYDELEV